MQVVQVNQVGCFLGIKTVAPEIEAAGGGTIVNTASYTALTGMAVVGAYAATKHAIVGLTRVAALELAGKGIRVNAVCPGAVDTPMTNPAGWTRRADRRGDGEAVDELYRKLVPLGRIGQPGGGRQARALPDLRGLLVHHRPAVRRSTAAGWRGSASLTLSQLTRRQLLTLHAARWNSRTHRI